LINRPCQIDLLVGHISPDNMHIVAKQNKTKQNETKQNKAIVAKIKNRTRAAANTNCSPGFDPSLKDGLGLIPASRNPLAGTKPSGDDLMHMVPPVMTMRTRPSGYCVVAAIARQCWWDSFVDCFSRNYKILYCRLDSLFFLKLCKEGRCSMALFGTIVVGNGVRHDLKILSLNFHQSFPGTDW